MIDGTRTCGRRCGLRRVVLAVLAIALLAIALLSASPGAAGAQQRPPERSASTTTAPPTTTTGPKTTRPTTTAPPQTTLPPTTQATAPEAREEEASDSDDDGFDEEEVAAVGAVDAEVAQGITFTTVANLLIPGDGTEGVQQATTTTAPAGEGGGADDENRLIWMIIAGLGGVALLVGLLTWRYWLLTRPGLDLGDDVGSAGRNDDRPYRGPQGEWPAGAGRGTGAGTATDRSAPLRRGQGAPDRYWDEPRDPRRTFVGPPSDHPGAPPCPPAAPR
ncbi:MAG TPA: hypothetical protein VJM75_09825, partial [Acidimicrobiales bacterium]|nr:hypothetical protein [Acidimicrobiales bacterium]